MHSIESAAAKSLRGAPAMCVPQGHNDFDEVTDENFNSSGSFEADGGGTDSDLTCAFPEFDTFTRSEVVTLSVYFYDNNSTE